MKRRNDSVANINDRIKVKLTENGKSILNNYDHHNLSQVEYLSLPSDYSPHPEDADGYCEFTLWEFMSIFGAHFCNGGPQLVENNEIVFLPKISQESAQIMFDEWVAYAEDCLHKNKWQYLSFPIWLGSVRKLTKDEINKVTDLVSNQANR